MPGLQVPTADGAPPFCPIAGLNLQSCKIVGHNFHLSYHAFKTIFIAGIHLWVMPPIVGFCCSFQTLVSIGLAFVRTHSASLQFTKNGTNSSMSWQVINLASYSS
jgi:hypothetical protein